MADTRKFVVMLSADLIALEANSNAKTQFLNVPITNSADQMVATACECWKIDPQDTNKYCLIFDDTKKYLCEGN